MKQVSLAVVAALWAATALSARPLTAEQKACMRQAVAAKNAAVKECKAKKGKEKAECMKSAHAAFIGSRKACMPAKGGPAAANAAPAAN